MSIQLDPREVLDHLNSMGYRNISADILKEFMKNLKRLITYETRYSLRSPNVNAIESPIVLNKNNLHDHFEKLYKTTTEATRARIDSRLKTDRENDDPYDPYKFDRRRVDEPVDAVDAHLKKPKTKQGDGITNQLKRIKQTAEQSKTCENVVKRSQPSRPHSAPTTSHYIRNTPTDLYQNYQKEWSRFKHLLPGESPRFNERQIIRKRMETIQKFHPKPKVFVLMKDDNTKIIRREVPELK